MNEVFSIPVDKMFEYLFTDSPFFRSFAETRKTYGEYFFRFLLNTFKKVTVINTFY